MPEATCIDVPSGKLSSETTTCTHPTQSMSGKVNENKLSEQINHIESGNLSTKSQQMHNGDSNLVLVAGSVVTERLEAVAEKKTVENLVIHSSDVIKSCQTEKSSIKDFGILYNVPIKTSTAESDYIATEYLKPSLEDVKKIHSITQLESEDAAKSSSLEQFETPSKSLVKTSRQIGRRDKQTAKSRNKKYKLRSSAGSDRVLRSKVQEKPNLLESSNSLGAVGNGVEKKIRGRKKGGAKKVVADEFSRTRKRLRYFLNRIHYEQNLIDAYSSEGWKGNSLEKLKPEKELQRATSEILRRKLKIRDLFQQLDSLCTEGRFPKSLFDSEGQIDSEDIYCAKCGSKDLSAGNDIILCDGACDRGFHQFCLEPPLLSEDIPPDDDGWLCPGCDCKVDCIDLLNDSLGTNLSVTDSWEKVFPEAAAAAREGKDQDHNLQLPSDDSDDDDYDPDRPGTVEKVEGSESSSDDSEYTSGSDELEAPQKNEQNLALSSDDSEDDDYDPNAPDVVQSKSPSRKAQHEQNLGLSSDDSEDNEYDPDAPDVDGSAKQESSSSDFTSDSEDLDAVLDNEFSSNHEVNMSSTSSKQNLKRRGNKSSLKDELLGILGSGPGQDGSPPISGKRHVERLDYKKLHDETYGNVSSDSSDDEDWNDSSAPRKRKKTTEQLSSVSPNGDAKVINYDHEGNEHSPRTTHQKSVVKGTHNSPGKSLEDSPKSNSTSGRAKSSSSRRLGEAVIQRLYKSFKDNQYPDRATKQALAEELGIRPQQVSKWFENTRWSWRHSSGNGAGVSGTALKESAPSPQAKKKLVEQDAHIGNSASNGTQKAGLPSTSITMPESSSGNIDDGKAKGVAEESSGQKPTTLMPAKRRGRPRIEKPETGVVVDTPQTTGTRRSGRRRNSGS